MRTTENAGGQPPAGHASPAPEITEDKPSSGQTTHQAIRRKPRRAVEWLKTKYTGSWADDLWGRLDAADFMTQAFLLAATFLLCAVPFLIIATALAGRSAAATMTSRLGLNQQASADVGHLFASSTATSAAITGTSWIFFVLGGVAAASTVQTLYQRVFQVRPGKWDKLLALAWLALVVGWSALGTAVGHGFRESAPALWWIINVPAMICFWWFTMWSLLAGRVAWRRLLPCAVATGLFWIGMLVVFHFTFSGMVISSYQEYGPIGVVFDLMSFFIAIGVVITLGATTGMMWRDRGMSFRSAAKKLRRTS